MKKYVLGGVVLVLVGVMSCELFLSNTGARFGCNLIADFEAMPANDGELTAWLRVQPGVVPDSLHVFRKRQSLIVVFLIDRNLQGRPAVPDLGAKCKTLGYAGPDGTFRDCPLPIVFPSSEEERGTGEHLNDQKH
jgi:hypothetical protein